MKLGPAISRSLAALLDESVPAVRVLRDDDERLRLEAALAFQGRAHKVIVLMLRRHAGALLGLDLRVEAPCTDAQRDGCPRLGKELPGLFHDQDAALADVLGTEPMTVGGSGNTHRCVHFLICRACVPDPFARRG